MQILDLVKYEPRRKKTGLQGFGPGLTQTSLYSFRKRLEAQNLGFKKKRNFTISIVKTKALISCAVTAQLICAVVFAYAKFRFSHDTAYIKQASTVYDPVNRIIYEQASCYVSITISALRNVYSYCYALPDLKQSRDARKPVFGVSNQVRHKLACTVSGKGWKLEIWDLTKGVFVLSMLRKQRH